MKPGLAIAQRMSVASIAMLFFVPFVVPIRRFPIPTFDGELLAALLLGLAITVAGLSSTRAIRIQWPLPVFLLTLIAIAVAQWLAGQLAYTYSLTTLTMAAMALFAAYSIGRWVREEGLEGTALNWIAIALIVGGLASVFIQVLQLLAVRGLPPALYLETPRSFPFQALANVGQPNQLAAYLALGISSAVYLVRGGGRSSWIRFAWLAVAVLAMGIAFTLSRMGLLMLFLLTAWILWRPGDSSKRTGRGFVAALWIGYVVGMVAGPQLVAEVSGGGSVLSRFMHSAYGDRMAMWTDAVRIALMHPLLGVGVGEYAAAQYWVTAAGNYTVGTPYAHNAILQLGAEFGVAAALYFTLLIGWWLFSRARQRWTDPRVSAVLMMGALLIVHGMLEWSLWVMFVSIPAALLFALGEPDSYRTIRISARSTLLPIGCAGLLYLPLIYVDFDSVARVGGRLVEEQQHNGGGSAESVVGVVEFGTATYFKPQAERMILSVTPLSPPIDDDQIAQTARVLSRLPDEQTIALHVSALALGGRVEEAMRHAERLRAFAVTSKRYELAERQVLRAIAAEGQTAEPLRAKLAALR